MPDLPTCTHVIYYVLLTIIFYSAILLKSWPDKKHPRIGEFIMKTVEDYNALIKDWEYCYCLNCDKVRYSADLTATEQGIKCSVCGSYDLEAPAWVNCPQEWKNSAVKCPRGGSGIRKTNNGEEECIYFCSFRHA